MFDLIICLVVDDITLQHRPTTRTTNVFGQNPEELAAALACNSAMRTANERVSAVVVDAQRPVADVMDLVLD